MPNIAKQKPTAKKKPARKKTGGVADLIQPIGFEDDEEFTICRQLAHDAMQDVMNRYERDFNAL